MRLIQLQTLSLLLALVAVRCEPKQWIVILATDAPVPQLGDTLLVQVLDERGAPACDSCAREIPADRDSRWPLSFGISPDVLTGARTLHVRAQLYRADHVQRDGELNNVYLDAVGQLPWLDGQTRAALTLYADCFKVRSQIHPWLFSTCDPRTRVLGDEPLLQATPDSELPKPGSWKEGQPVPCQGGVSSQMACIEGGAFVMGGLHYFGAPAERDNISAASPESLVVLSAFAMDKDEVLVRDLRALQVQYPQLKVVQPLATTDSPYCNWTGTSADATSQLPLNCIDRDMAELICLVQKKRLPTEAEWEFAAGDRDAENLYPWGRDPDVCGHSVVGRGDFLASSNIDVTCRIDKDGHVVDTGPVALGHPLDVTPHGLRNMGGNVAEWVQDDFESYSAPCWGRLPLWRNWLLNPVCQRATQQPNWISRGGNWGSPTADAATIQRRLEVPPQTFSDLRRYDGVGVRCVASK